ncbi:unnamed protein product [Ectocarpus sp. 12 AP-2014]
MFSAAVALGVSASAANAEQMLSVDGVEYPLSVLTANCQSMSDNPQAMIACFNALSAMMEGKPAEAVQDTVSVTQALDDLRAVAQYQDSETGLGIAGADCTIRIVYFGNYFHVSRRNVSAIDLYSAQFDASKLNYDQIAPVSGAQVPLYRASMDVGATAIMSGGVGLESAQHAFSPKSARLSMGAYANEVAGQLASTKTQAFDFVLVHPKRSQASTQIWNAFETFVKACRGSQPSWLVPKTN